MTTSAKVSMGSLAALARGARRSAGDGVPERCAAAQVVLGAPADAREHDPHGRCAERRCRLGADRRPDAGIDADVALDGIDELLCGFFTRGKSKLFDGTEFDVLVAPTDSDRRWRLHVAERMTVDDAGGGDVDVTITGSADAIYLALWNRGDEIEVAGDDTLLERWRATQRVRWS